MWEWSVDMYIYICYVHKREHGNIQNMIVARAFAFMQFKYICLSTIVVILIILLLCIMN